jgi:hypothetical protein
MPKVFYYLLGVAALIFATGFLFSQFVEYKQYRLSQEKAIQACVEETAGPQATGFVAANAAQKCRDKFTR